jgi:hypothetical protein
MLVLPLALAFAVLLVVAGAVLVALVSSLVPSPGLGRRLSQRSNGAGHGKGRKQLEEATARAGGGQGTRETIEGDGVHERASSCVMLVRRWRPAAAQAVANVGCREQVVVAAV